MVVLWDTFGLFEELLNNLGKLLEKSESLGVTPDEAPAMRVAKTGFALFQPLSNWSQEHDVFITMRLEGGLSLEALSWFEECAEAVCIFSCLALGSMLGKFQAGEIDDTGFLLGEVHLPGFIAEKAEAICGSS